MTEHKDKQASSADTTKERDKQTIDETSAASDAAVGVVLSEPDKCAAAQHERAQPHERKRLSQFWDKLPLSVNKKASRSSSSSPSPTHRNPQHQVGQSAAEQKQHQAMRQMPMLGDDLWHGHSGCCTRSREGSFQSEVIILDLHTGAAINGDDAKDVDDDDAVQSVAHPKDEYGTQRVYKKTSPNCVLTLYLPTREIMLSGSGPSILRGIVYVDPKAIQGYRVYAQLTLTFRYGREDEEVMGLRFCNEAIMSLHQVWPRNEEPARESLSPLQEALVKRLGEGAHPFTLTLTSQAPPSVQLVPAKRYYGAPIGTSYDVRCFIADKTDEKFHRRASVKMGVRVIYRTDVFHQHDANGPEHFADLINSGSGSAAGATSTSTPPPLTAPQSATATTPPVCSGGLVSPTEKSAATQDASLASTSGHDSGDAGGGVGGSEATAGGIIGKPRKSERGDSFPKLRLSPKSFRFSGRFGRSKSEIEKCPTDPFYNYSKSFQEYDSVIAGCGVTSGGGPQGAVDKPFLLQDGRVGLRASLDKGWYTHGEDVTVTVNIRNDSRKTVRKVRVCAIQHVDVCMFNNGKFKNIVADSDATSPVERTVPPGGCLNTTVVLRPQRGPTKNWIALEDTLQRSTEPEEITGSIAASAIRSPNIILPPGGGPNSCQSPAVCIPLQAGHTSASSSGGAVAVASVCAGASGNADNRNVFAIYVSYYVKVKLTLSGMGGELSLKLPFMLVHVDEQQRGPETVVKFEKLSLKDVPPPKKITAAKGKALKAGGGHSIDRIETIDDEINIRVPSATTSRGDSTKRRLVRSETMAKDLDEETDEQLLEGGATLTVEPASDVDDLEHVHMVEIHAKPKDELKQFVATAIVHECIEAQEPLNEQEEASLEPTASVLNEEDVPSVDDAVGGSKENDHTGAV